MKEYNKSEFGSYKPLADESKYNEINPDRLENPKFTFRKSKEFVDDWRDGVIDSWTDVGCGNGELIYYLANEYDETEFKGIDITLEFIETAEDLLSEFSNVEIYCDDVLNLDEQIGQSEVVSCLGTFEIFPDPEPILNALLDLVESGGLLVIDGCFNQYDVSMKVEYKDDSTEHTGGEWRCDFNLHSETWIEDVLEKRNDIKNHRFEYERIDVEIPKDEDAPDIHMWTERAHDGSLRITNGMGRYFDPSFLVIETL
jgi:SAM-dependent methyltransferase